LKNINSEPDFPGTLDNKEQQVLATILLPCSPLSSINFRMASIPPLSVMDLHISSCRSKEKEK
jgi:hypothetical protein